MNYLQLCLTEVFVKVLINSRSSKVSEVGYYKRFVCSFLKRCFKLKCHEFHEIGKRKYLVQTLNKVGIFQVIVVFFKMAPAVVDCLKLCQLWLSEGRPDLSVFTGESLALISRQYSLFQP